MTRVIHTGDTHIGYQQYNAPERRRDFLRAFRQVAEDAVADDVDAVIHAGDLFHDRRPDLPDLQGTVEVLRTLDEADVPFLAVVGNHESKRDAQWLDLFADLGLAIRLGAEPELVGDVAVYGLDFVPRSRRDDLAYEFDPLPAEADHAALVGHGLFEPFAHADWDTDRVLESATVDFDAVLLGDNHAPDTAEVSDTWVTYCGSTERASAGEREDRGYNIVTFDDAVAITRRGLDATREFVFVDVELEPGEGTDRVRERIGQYDLADAVVVVTIDGDGDPVTPATIEEFALDRDALVARVNDRRDVEDDGELSVSFADPDAAVRDRVRSLGLSDAALSIDGAVRDDALVDANVRETVERRVRELLDADRSAFQPEPADESRDSEELRTDANSTGDDGRDDLAGAASDDDGDRPVESDDATDWTEESDGPADRSEESEGPAAGVEDDESDRGEGADSDDRDAADAIEHPESDGSDATDGTGSDERADGDAGAPDQVTMGDFS